MAHSSEWGSRVRQGEAMWGRQLVGGGRQIPDDDDGDDGDDGGDCDDVGDGDHHSWALSLQYLSRHGWDGAQEW